MLRTNGSGSYVPPVSAELRDAAAGGLAGLESDPGVARMPMGIGSGPKRLACHSALC
mgnify:CR=1 FL=1